MPFKHFYLRADLTTSGGAKLIGTGPWVGAFHNGEHYQFNRALRGMSIDAARRLASKLREHDIFPLQISITATGWLSDFNWD